MAEKRAYALKESFTEDFQGAGTTLVDGRSLDIGARLSSNDGVIVTSDPDEIRALEDFHALKSVPVPAEKSARKSGGDKE